MAKHCIACNKAIGILSLDYKFSDDKDVNFCRHCYEKVPSIRSKINDMKDIMDLTEFQQIENEVISVLEKNNFSSEAIEHIKKFMSFMRDNQLKQLEGKLKRVESQKELEFEKERKSTISFLEIKAHMLTTGFDFEGYRIISYNGVVSGTNIVGSGLSRRITGVEASFFGQIEKNVSDTLQNAKEVAMKELIMQSIIKGGNAIIGIDFDYIMLADVFIGVSANGTSVNLEKIE